MPRPILPLLFLFAGSAAAQTFTLLPDSLPGRIFPALGLADVDADGHLDLVIAGDLAAGGRATNLYRGNGAGAFALDMQTSFAAVSEADLALADLDGDGDVDLLLSGNVTQARGLTKLYRNDGRGGFTEVPDTPFEALANGVLATADVDGDGDVDVLLAGQDSSGGAVRLYLNAGDGRFAPASGSAFKPPFSPRLAFADLDGDRDQDLVIGGTAWPQAAAVYANDGAGVFSDLPQVGYSGVSFSSVVLGDVDGDGDADAVFTGEDGPTGAALTRIYLNDGRARFRPAFPQPFVDVSLGEAALADTDGDGDLDVLLTGQSAGDRARDITTLHYVNDGRGAFAQAPVQPFAPLYLSRFAVGDLDEDGDLDVIVSGSRRDNTLATLVYRNDPGASSARESGERPRLRLSPNPVSAGGTLRVAHEGASARAVRVDVFDARGRVILSQYVAPAAGQDSVEIAVPKVAPGVYALRVGERWGRFVVE